ncbi:hypothetical protein GYMLUDRAFT_56553 [Collybiopsis luxurians FD-317 M1]|nr:hypothetical protein GYMLUDRAFT_56553 [Collybiopsis luxurians FD-317 M1]
MVHEDLFLELSLWVMEDYHRIEEEVTRAVTNCAHRCSLLGNPGIGKSTFLVYLLVLRLSQQLPTFYHKGLTYFFNETGAYQVNGNSKDVGPFNELDPTYALVDSDLNPVPTRFWLSRCTIPVLVSSLDSTKYRHLDKQNYKTKMIIAKIPSFEEAMNVWKCQSDIDVEDFELRLAEIWTDFGPNLCLGSKLLWRDSNTAVMKYCIHSHTIMWLLLKVSQSKGLQDRQTFFWLFHLSPALAPSLGQLFEIMAIERLASGFTGTLELLQCPDQKAKKSWMPECKHLELPLMLVRYFDNKINDDATKDRSLFYIPEQKTNSAWDAFCYVDNIGHGLQFTVRKDYKLKKDSLLALQKCFHAAEVESVCFTIVMPKDIPYKLPEDLDTPQTKPKFKFYHLQLDLGFRHNDAFVSLFNCDSEDDAIQVLSRP